MRSEVVHLVPAQFSRHDGVIGGAERYAFELARHMAAVVPTSLLTFGERTREYHEGPLRVRVIGSPWYVRGQRSNPFSLRLAGALTKAAVVHCHQQHVVASTFAAALCRVSARRVCCTDRGGGGWDLSSYVSTDRLYDAHLHISKYSRRVFGHAKNPSAAVIGGGVDVVKFSPRRDRRRDGGVLFVGRLLPHKGVDQLIRALPSNVPAVIIGPPADQRYVNDLRALAEGKSITFRHDCDDEALVDAYRNALCVVLPSVYDDMYGHHTDVPELLGQTLLEGMACGTPAVCTSVASLPEIVRDGETGFVVSPGDAPALQRALLCFANNPHRARQMGESARAMIESRFTWPQVVERCLERYGALN
jgi:glycosyltransferase involved in cell wall biosynthesis